MAKSLNFTVDDTSPTISYLPFADSFPPNLTAGWNSFFNDSGSVSSAGFSGELGIGTSYHVTSFDQASISITWRGTGIQALGQVKGNASYSITLDGVLQTPDPKNEALADFQHVTDGVHTLVISTVIPGVIPGSQSKFFFDKAVIYFNTSSPMDLVELNNVSFHGLWDLKKIGNETVHQSQTKGDVVQSTFTEGASFLLNGVTSPTAGTYSVTVDSNKSTLSGESTFTNPDTLLFYVTGLDPTVPHKVQIRNEDGHDLFLKSDGFKAFVPQSASVQHASSPPNESGAAVSKGTIAALVLAGILGFLIISGLLYFFLVVRPQKRREMMARLARRRRKEKEAGPLGVLNIAPAVFPDDTEIGSQEGTIGHHKKHSSEKSGFARWKREVEGGFENILGITFRHSGSTGKKSRRSGVSRGPSSAKSSVFTLSSLFTLSSSKRSHGKGKKKAKSKQVSESSNSTNIALEFSVKPDSPDSFKEKNAELSRLPPDPYVSESDMHTLSYMNTPSAASGSGPILSHSRSGTEETSRSTPQPLPRSSSRDHSFHASESSGQQGSVGFLLNYDDPKTSSQEDEGDSVPSMPPPFNPAHLSTLAPRERGSARYSSDDATSYYLGSAATRLAIRSLRPRITQSPDIQSFEGIEQKTRTSDKTHGQDDRAIQPAPGPPSPPNSDFSFLHVVTPAIRPIDIPPTEIPQIEIPPAGIPELPHNISDISPSSPFRVDFPDNSSRASSRLELPVITTPPEGNFEQNAGTLRSVLRLTPSSNQPISEKGRDSFLDFGTSLNISHQHQSPPSENVTQSKQSRWSTSTLQTTNLSRSASSNVSAPVTSPTSGPTSYFPYPVSLTPSPYHPEGHLPTRPARSRSAVLNNEAQQTDRRLAQLRLSAFGPPPDPDSVPMSVTSEKRPRHSGSTSDFGGVANSSQLLPHPPLPHKHSNASLPPSS